MNHILTERLRLGVPDAGNLTGHKFLLELMLMSTGRDPSHIDRASALADYGSIKHRNMPFAICLQETGDLIGVMHMTMNLDAFTMVQEEGKAAFKTAKPLEIGLRLFIYHRHRYQGYGFEAAQAFIEYMTTVLLARRIISESSATEPHAIRLMKRLEMAVRPSRKPDRPDRIIGFLHSPAAVQETDGDFP